jgi:hypothetical protein
VHLEKVTNVRDNRLRSIRIDQFWRGSCWRRSQGDRHIIVDEAQDLSRGSGGCCGPPSPQAPTTSSSSATPTSASTTTVSRSSRSGFDITGRWLGAAPTSTARLPSCMVRVPRSAEMEHLVSVVRSWLGDGMRLGQVGIAARSSVLVDGAVAALAGSHIPVTRPRYPARTVPALHRLHPCPREPGGLLTRDTELVVADLTAPGTVDRRFRGAAC